MIITRSGLLRGGLAAASLPLIAPSLVAPSLARASGRGEAFSPEGIASGAHPWTATPGIGPQGLRFAVIGDNTAMARPGVFDQAMVQMNWLRPDFVLSVGDLIEGYTEDRAEIARQWDAVERSIAKVNCPFVFAPGNHDVDNAETLDAWRERRGASYYSFTYKGALFLILNTEDPPVPMPPKMAKQYYGGVELMKTDPDRAEKMAEQWIASGGDIQKGEYSSMAVVNFGERQLAFVRDQLARHHNVQWTFVVMHKPAWKMRCATLPILQSMLRGRPYTVFAGHTHYFTHDVFDGADYINMGTTGGTRQQNGPGTMDHVMVVSMTAAGPTYANTRLSGLMDVAGASGQVRAY